MALPLAAALTLSFTVAALVTIVAGTRSIESGVRGELRSLASSVGADIGAYLEECIRDLKLCADEEVLDDIRVRDVSPPQRLFFLRRPVDRTRPIRNLLLRFARIHEGRFLELAVLDERGSVVTSTRPDRAGRRANLGQLRLPAGGRSANRPTAVAAMMPGDRALVIAYPVLSRSKDRSVSWVVGFVDWRPIAEIATSAPISGRTQDASGFMALVDARGRVLALPRSLPAQVRSHVAAATADLGPGRAGGSGVRSASLGGTSDYLLAWTTVRNAPASSYWTLVVFRETRSVFTIVRFFARSVFAAAVLGLLLACGGAFLVARGLSGRIRRLMEGTRRIALGDLSIRVPASDSDELAGLGRSFNAMVEQMEERDRELTYYRDWLEVRVEERTRELQAAKEAAESASQAKSEFLANMSHELRTPLHGVLSFADLGGRRTGVGGDPKLREYFQRIQASGSRLLGLVNDLLDLAKLEAGGRDFSFATHAADEVVGSVTAELSSLLGPRGLMLKLASSERVVATMDREAIMQVVRNLIGNAIKFSPQAGSIEVAVRGRGESVWITVSDRGPGIPKDELETIFDKFMQSRRTKTQAGGTGLGLAISREIVTRHGGRIWAENRAGGGAAFVVELPCGALGTTEATPPQAAAA